MGEKEREKEIEVWRKAEGDLLFGVIKEGHNV